jgi:FAD synthase
MQVSHFNFILKNIVQKMPSHCSIVIIGDFNIIFLTNTNQSSTLQAFMNKYNFKLTFIESTTINDTQIDHIWINTTMSFWNNTSILDRS